jgi:RNA polymerase sigma-70 factor (ECF subfamily)
MSQLAAEEALVTAAMAGDTFALEQLLCAHLSPLERYIEPKIPANVRRHLGTEDLLQEILAEAFRGIQHFEYRGDGSFLAWLRAIADHRLADELRRLGRKKRGGDRQQLLPADGSRSGSVTTLLDWLYEDSHLPEHSVARREAERAIHVALAGLPEDQRQAVRGNILQEKSIEEVALEMGRTGNAVRGLVHRGKKNLAEAMGRSSRWFSKR